MYLSVFGAELVMESTLLKGNLLLFGNMTSLDRWMSSLPPAVSRQHEGASAAPAHTRVVLRMFFKRYLNIILIVGVYFYGD